MALDTYTGTEFSFSHSIQSISYYGTLVGITTIDLETITFWNYSSLGDPPSTVPPPPTSGIIYPYPYSVPLFDDFYATP